MSAYVIVNIDVTDPVRYEQYRKLAAATVAAYQGKYLARGGPTERLEGTYEPKRLVVLEFPTAERARAWWSSDEYRPARELRQTCARADMILVEGV